MIIRSRGRSIVIKSGDKFIWDGISLQFNPQDKSVIQYKYNYAGTGKFNSRRTQVVDREKLWVSKNILKDIQANIQDFEVSSQDTGMSVYTIYKYRGKRATK